MALYEITFLTRDETDPGVKSTIEEGGGVIQEESSMGRRKLAYPINKETQAVYTTYVFDADTKALPEIDRRLRLNTEVMRYLTIVKPLEPQNKEVTKTVREAIEAAEKLEDLTEDAKTVAPAVTAAVADVEEVSEPVEVTPSMEIEEVIEAPVAEDVPTEEVKPAKKPRAKKAEPADAAEATEEDRLKALEDKLSDILKD